MPNKIIIIINLIWEIIMKIKNLFYLIFLILWGWKKCLKLKIFLWIA
jgi:hypothetical protein